jgi:hypothetical protein
MGLNLEKKEAKYILLLYLKKGANTMIPILLAPKKTNTGPQKITVLWVKALTLIRAAGGVYDFRNFEEEYLCNGLSSELQNLCIPRKTSREYILLSTYEQKTAFFGNLLAKTCAKPPILSPFLPISGGLEGLFNFYDPLHHHPWTGRSPRQ